MFETIFARKQYKSEAEDAKEGRSAEAEGETEEEEGNKDRCFKEELPYDIMQVILQRLPLSDYLTFRDVSHCWRAAIIDSKRWLPAAHQLPWLLTSFYDDMQTFYIKTQSQ